MGGTDAYLSLDGSLVVPISCPESWPEQYFYVVNHHDDLAEPVEPLRCVGLIEREVRRSTRKVPLDWPAFSLFVSVLCALDTPSGYVEPWQIRVGGQTSASLHPPPWVVFAPFTGVDSVSYAIERATPAALAIEREVRLRHVEFAMRSSISDSGWRLARLSGEHKNVQSVYVLTGMVNRANRGRTRAASWRS